MLMLQTAHNNDPLTGLERRNDRLSPLASIALETFANVHLTYAYKRQSILRKH